MGFFPLTQLFLQLIEPFFILPDIRSELSNGLGRHGSGFFRCLYGLRSSFAHGFLNLFPVAS